MRFAGQYNDQESGLSYNYFRYYNSLTGRYVTSDPIGMGGGGHTYEYVGGNPLRFIDFFGLKFGFVDPIFKKHLWKIKKTEKGKELWGILNKSKLIINIRKGRNHCDSNASKIFDEKGNHVGWNLRVYTEEHNHLKLPGYKDDEFIHFTPSVTRTLAHEMGHATGTPEGNDRWFDRQMINVEKWENSVMTELDGITRPGYEPSGESRCSCVFGRF